GRRARRRLPPAAHKGGGRRRFAAAAAAAAVRAARRSAAPPRAVARPAAVRRRARRALVGPRVHLGAALRTPAPRGEEVDGQRAADAPARTRGRHRALAQAERVVLARTGHGRGGRVGRAGLREGHRPRLRAQGAPARHGAGAGTSGQERRVDVQLPWAFCLNGPLSCRLVLSDCSTFD
ncbi:hypothetical protein DFJ74DRAFT_716236, partial [Hyaloraphidium curvatum]